MNEYSILNYSSFSYIFGEGREGRERQTRTWKMEGWVSSFCPWKLNDLSLRLKVKTFCQNKGVIGKTKEGSYFDCLIFN